MIHVIKNDMDPNSNVNYHRKIAPMWTVNFVINDVTISLMKFKAWGSYDPKVLICTGMMW